MVPTSAPKSCTALVTGRTLLSQGDPVLGASPQTFNYSNTSNHSRSEQHECPACLQASSVALVPSTHTSLSSCAHAATSPPRATSCAGCASTRSQTARRLSHPQARCEHHGRSSCTKHVASEREGSHCNTYSGRSRSGRWR